MFRLLSSLRFSLSSSFWPPLRSLPPGPPRTTTVASLVICTALVGTALACSQGSGERDARPADPDQAAANPGVDLGFVDYPLPPAAGDPVCDTFGTADIAGQYMLQNNIWNDAAEGSQCVTPLWDAETETAGFLVSTEPNIFVNDTAPASYPSIVLGWHFGEMYGGYTEAKQLGEIDAVPSVFSVNAPRTGSYNIAYDLWLHPTEENPSGPGGGLELMIWLTFRSASPIGSRVGWAEIGDDQWEVWRGLGGGSTWDVVTFRHSEHTDRLDVDLRDFIDAVSEHTDVQLTDDWYLLSVQAGFEIWDLTGEMATAEFSARVE